MDNYSNYNPANQYNDPYSMPINISKVMRSVYFKMFLALLVTAFTSLWAVSTPAVFGFLSKTMLVFVIVELAIVFFISGTLTGLSSGTATLLFYLFAVVNGLTLSPIFVIYTHTSIAKTFFITAGTFGAMSIFGYTTRQDLSRWGSMLIMALIGLIIASVVNIFLKSTQMDWIISGAGVLIFVGLTAWDTQQIKSIAANTPHEMQGKLATIGALNLYLDFVNMFLYLLRFFGSNRD